MTTEKNKTAQDAASSLACNSPETPFCIRPDLKVELARLYSPGLSDHSAMTKLNGWIRRNPELHRLMYGGREGKRDTYFSTRQVRLLVHYLNEP